MHSAMGPRAPYRHSLKAHSVVRVHDGVSVQRETLGHRDTILTVVSAGQLQRQPLGVLPLGDLRDDSIG